MELNPENLFINIRFNGLSYVGFENFSVLYEIAFQFGRSYVNVIMQNFFRRILYSETLNEEQLTILKREIKKEIN